jgi:hypothetical protein
VGLLDESVLRRSRALQEMLRLARSIVADEHVTEMEAKVLRAWIDRHPDMLGVWPVNEILGILRDTLADGHLSEAEREELRTLLHRVAGDE